MSRRAGLGRLSGALLATALLYATLSVARAEEPRAAGPGERPVAPAAPAARSASVELAERLFREGQALLEEGDAAAACPLLEESYRQDPQTGTLLNIATCHEDQGRLLMALREYEQARAEDESRSPGSPRARYAAQRAAAVRLALPSLIIELAEPGVSISLDGLPLDPGALRAPLPVDPGVHELRASAPGKRPWTARVPLEAGERGKSIRVPALEAPAAPSPTASEAPSPAVVSGTQRPVFWIALGATALSGGAALWSGLEYLSRRDTFDSARRDPSADVDERRRLRDDARRMGLVNAGLSAATVVGIAACVYLGLETAPEDAPSPSVGALELEIGPREISIVGHF